MDQLRIDDHPLLDAVVFLSTWPAPLGEQETPAAVRAAFGPGADAPMTTDDTVRAAVRDLLRHGGFKPTGRSRPASEYLRKAVEKGWLAPDRTINPAVDTCNAVSLHSGLPISVVDADRARPPWRIGICPAGTAYVFNPAGQVIDIGGLLSLHDAQGPCGGPVKDSQRTKTHDGTTRTLTVIWGTRALPGRAAEAWRWTRALLEQQGVTTRCLATAST
ncbi:MAG: hypothetical protein D6798_12795 [Deltaproteobacteria bacterium]|nr:MAG: hypothetical protein D6798_12795 [Deltaproteobacteria bacterium]